MIPLHPSGSSLSASSPTPPAADNQSSQDPPLPAAFNTHPENLAQLDPNRLILRASKNAAARILVAAAAEAQTQLERRIITSEQHKAKCQEIGSAVFMLTGKLPVNETLLSSLNLTGNLPGIRELSEGEGQALSYEVSIQIDIRHGVAAALAQRRILATRDAHRIREYIASGQRGHASQDADTSIPDQEESDGRQTSIHSSRVNNLDIWMEDVDHILAGAMEVLRNSESALLQAQNILGRALTPETQQSTGEETGHIQSPDSPLRNRLTRSRQRSTAHHSESIVNASRQSLLEARFSIEQIRRVRTQGGRRVLFVMGTLAPHLLELGFDHHQVTEAACARHGQRVLQQMLQHTPASWRQHLQSENDNAPSVEGNAVSR